MTDVKPVRRPARWLLPAVAAAAVLGLVTLAVAVFGGNASTPATQSSAPPIAWVATEVVGPAWRLVSLEDEFGTMSVPRARNPHDTAALTFKPNGELDGNDGVNGISARYRPTGHGYEVVGPVMVGAEGLVGSADSPAARVEAAIDACSTDLSVHVRLSIRGNTMTLHAGHRTLTLLRGAATGH